MVTFYFTYVFSLVERRSKPEFNENFQRGRGENFRKNEKYPGERNSCKYYT